ncbi:MAG TPA: DUF881 domain-containing protein [Acidothermaceae bacterium]|nr:DUF881 domain-containing protein [Acidothermaceae bacterium]
MSILVDLMANAVDEGYANAAARRGAQPVPTTARPTAVAANQTGLRGRAAIGAAVALALAGALFATAAVATHRGNAAANRDRKRLVAQVTLQTAATNALERQVSTLSTQVSNARTSALSLTDRGASLLSQIKELELVDGAVPVVGTGVRVILDDAPSSHAAGSDGSGVIVDSDLRAAVNGLFVAGAQAVSINGQRLTAQTAIREAGGAILVDFRPLSPPYTIDAIGPSSLGSTFSSSETGQLFVTDHQLYGLGFTVDDHQRLTLPSAANVVVHYAKPLESP